MRSSAGIWYRDINDIELPVSDQKGTSIRGILYSTAAVRADCVEESTWVHSVHKLGVQLHNLPVVGYHLCVCHLLVEGMLTSCSSSPRVLKKSLARNRESSLSVFFFVSLMCVVWGLITQATTPGCLFTE